MNTGTPTPMRGPGETPGLFALESAMDELAVATGINPVELRLRNYAERDRTNNRQPWSSKYLRNAMTGALRRSAGKPAEDPRQPARRTLADRLWHGERHISGTGRTPPTCWCA